MPQEKHHFSLRRKILNDALHEMESFVIVTLRRYQFLEYPQETALKNNFFKYLYTF